MKKFSLMLALCFSMSSFASEITLSPGSSAVLEVNTSTTVTCGSIETLPRCEFFKNESTYVIKINGRVSSSYFSTTEQVIKEIKVFRKAGICR